MNKIYILGHRDSDGYFASFCAYAHCAERGLSESVVHHSVQYGEPIPIKIASLDKTDAVYILDFSYDRDTLEAINSKVGLLVVLDHHKSAQEALGGLSYATFDMTKSGALLAWEYFYPGEEPPLACKYVNDRDLWKWEYKDATASFEAYLRLKNVRDDWAEWDKLTFDKGHLHYALAVGKSVVMHERAIVKSFVNNPNNISRLDLYALGYMHKAALYEGMGILTSEIANEVYSDPEVDLTIEYRSVGDKMRFSLRSVKVDVSSIAQVWGGGGHKSAAGFVVSLGEGFTIVSSMVQGKYFHSPLSKEELAA